MPASTRKRPGPGPAVESVIHTPEGAWSGYAVAIGASAGGLDALERFFQGIPPDTGAAYVVVQHLSPDHKSMMGNLLSRYTRMPVLTVQDAMPMQPDHVYLIPPGSLMTVSAGQLRLSPKNPRGLSLPIDLFFTSLAREYTSRAVGVVLSGTGSDGTRGAVAINDAGGLLLAQDLESAKFDGMPRSVIATGLVDAVLSPEELGPRLLEHIRQQPRVPPDRVDQPETSQEPELLLEEILHLLHQLGGVNFRDYKPATVLRRIERRMQVRHVPDYAGYLALLEGDRPEVLTLRREILIPVTNFFRDGESFELLGSGAIDTLLKERPVDQGIRVWVPGASTGEEAYSLAILFAEAFERARRWPNLKIFATDVEQQNIDAAGAGVYSESIVAEVSPERLERYFVRRGNHFVVKSEIRQNIVFARHNLLEDPPFTRMDLVSCRNVLIYFKTAAQQRVLRRLQYALAAGGFLFLGSSESLADLQRDFATLSSKHKIYRVLRHVSLAMESPDSGRTRPEGKGHGYAPRRRHGRVLPDAAAIDGGQAALLKHYAPASLLASSKLELIHVFGDCQRFLRFAEGAASLDLPRLLPERMSPVAMALMHKAAKDRLPIRSDLLSYELADGSNARIRLVVRPLLPGEGLDPVLLLSFESEPDLAPLPPSGVPVVDVQGETVARMQVLERELVATRESLQATIEELETANEELQATNEELMASNEELQSSNEELQSVNEELYTVNAENQEKIEILNRLNADLDSMAKAAAIATVFVDEQLRLTRFTPEASQLFKFRPGDIGRPIDDFSNLLDYPGFARELVATIGSGQERSLEIMAANGRCYLSRILSYQVPSTDIRGAVASFVDVTNLRDARRLQAILDAQPMRLAVLDEEGTIVLVNAAWHAPAAAADADATRPGSPGDNCLSAGSLSCGVAPEAGERARAAIRAVLEGGDACTLDYLCRRETGARHYRMGVAPVKAPGGGAVITHMDITLDLGEPSDA